jgi:hypothetical protein
MLAKFCQQQAAIVLSPRDTALLQEYLLRLLANRTAPPKVGQAYDWWAISAACGIAYAEITRAASVLIPSIDAVEREIAKRRG